MKVKMKSSGESPEFGIYEAGMIIDEARVCRATLEGLVGQGLAERESEQSQVADVPVTKSKREVKNHGRE